jgi:hypothetical protein
MGHAGEVMSDHAFNEQMKMKREKGNNPHVVTAPGLSPTDTTRGNHLLRDDASVPTTPGSVASPRRLRVRRIVDQSTWHQPNVVANKEITHST